MTKISDKLKSLFAENKKVAILGVGSELRLDDYAGGYIAKTVDERLAGGFVTSDVSGKAQKCELMSIDGGTAPENFTGVIREFAPSLILVIDAANMGKTPGDYAFLDGDMITGTTFSTHMLPLPFLISYIQETVSCKAEYIGIQPFCLGQGMGLDERVKKGCDEMIEEILSVVAESLK